MKILESEYAITGASEGEVTIKLSVCLKSAQELREYGFEIHSVWMKIDYLEDTHKMSGGQKVWI